MDDPAHKWKDLAVSEYWAQFTASGYAMVRHGDWKYVYHTIIDAQHPEQHELYNLVNDPKELHNLATMPEHQDRMTDMRKTLTAELGQNLNEIEQRSRAELHKGYERSDPKPPASAGEEG